MKTSWLAYTAVGVLGALAGVLVAGVPDRTPASATITTSTVIDTDAATGSDGDGADTSEESATTEEPDTTTEPDTTEAPATTEGSTTTATPTTTESTTTTVAPIPERGDIAVVSANGAGIAGIAAATAETLRDLGYTDVRETTGTEIFGETVIYYAEGFDQAANRLADDLGLADIFIVPIEGQVPIGAEFDDADIVVYLGQEQG